MDILTLHSEITRIEKKMDTIISFIEANHESTSKWLTSEDAMRLIGCKKSKLSEMRRAGLLEWRHLGNHRNVMITRRSVEGFIKSQCPQLKTA